MRIGEFPTLPAGWTLGQPETFTRVGVPSRNGLNRKPFQESFRILKGPEPGCVYFVPAKLADAAPHVFLHVSNWFPLQSPTIEALRTAFVGMGLRTDPEEIWEHRHP